MKVQSWMIAAVIAWASVVGAQSSEPASQPTTAAASQPTTTVAVLPTTEQADNAVLDYQTQLDAANKELREKEAVLATAGPDQTIIQQLPVVVGDITTRLTDDSRRLYPVPSLDVIGQMEKDWQEYQNQLAGWQAQNKRRTDDLTNLDSRLGDVIANWQKILQKVGGNPDRVGEVSRLLTQVQKQHDRFAAPLRQLRDLQTRLDDQLDRVNAFEGRLSDARAQAVSNLFVRDCEPFWKVGAFRQGPQSVVLNNYDSLREQWAKFKTYLSNHIDSVWLHAGLILALSFAARWMSRRSDEWTIRDADGAWYLSVLKLPIATGLALSLLAASWIYPAPPRLLWVIIGAASLLPLYLLLRRALEPRVRPLVRLFMVLWLVNNVVELLPSGDVLTRLLLLAETTCAALFMTYYSARVLMPKEADAPDANRRRIVTLMITRLSVTVLVASLLTNLFGFFGLARLLVHWLLATVFIAMIVRAGTRVLIALGIGAMHVWPLEDLRLVREHRPLVQTRLRWLLSLGGVTLWFFVTLNALTIRGPVIDAITRVLDGAIPGLRGLSLGDLLEFGITVFAAFAISRFVRFVLKEDVYPRVKLARGVPYAISTLLHYSILLIGLMLAFTALDVDRTKFTILASAFGVGIGFGLQNVVNNFVSGLLLLFERPVQVGDIVELEGGYVGSVSTIGIRASIVRTIDAAEVIVPNSLLISNRVINWTFSTRQRGFTLPVTIAPGCDPQAVLNAMLDAAAKTRLILQSPRPQAYLVEFSPAVGVKFEMRVWTAQFEDWITARSDLGVNLSNVCAAAKIQIK